MAYENVFERFKKQPCVNIFNLKLVELGKGYAKVETEIRKNYENELGVVWGAVFAAMADAAGSFSVITLIGDEKRAIVSSVAII